MSYIILSLCLLLSGCSSKAEKQTDEKKSIKIALTQDILSFDPMLTSDIYSEAVLRCIYTTLYDFDENLEIRKKLVKTEKNIDDYSWRFEIHDDVKFQDGSKLTVDDVVFSIERAMKGGRTQKALEVIDHVKKIDDTTFEIYCKEPYSDLPSLFAKAETSIVSKKVVNEKGYDFSKPVGAGPFKLLERKQNERISLKRYEDYYLEKAASPLLDFVIIVTEQERTASLLNGDIDILFSVSAYDSDKLKISSGVKLLQSPSSKIEYLSLNTTHAPLDNSKVRLAISYAINRENIANGVYHGYSTSSNSLIPKGIIGHVESPVTYDPEKARQLLQEAGYQDGFSFNVITIDTIRKNTLEYIKLDLAEVGIELNYDLVTMKEAADMMTENKHDSILVGWAFNSDPNSVLPVLLGTGSGKTMNSSNYSNPTVDQLIRNARGENNKEKKTDIYKEINSIVSNDSPIVVIQNPMVLSAAQNNIKDIILNPQGIIQYESIYRK